MTHLGISLSAFTAHVIRVTYGIVLDNHYYEMVERVLEVAEKILTPGRYAVEALPFLRNIPAWLPGSQFKRFAAEARRDVTTVVDRLFSTAKTIVSPLMLHLCPISDKLYPACRHRP